MRQSVHPHGWPGHVADHIVPLACGGADAPSNMQWQTTEEGKAKDKTSDEGATSGTDTTSVTPQADFSAVTHST